jgi:hypothetical protein
MTSHKERITSAKTEPEQSNRLANSFGGKGHDVHKFVKVGYLPSAGGQTPEGRHHTGGPKVRQGAGKVDQSWILSTIDGDPVDSNPSSQFPAVMLVDDHACSRW